MIEDDMVSLIRRLCPELRNVVTESEYSIRQPVHCIIVTQRQTSGNIDHLNRVDETFIDIRVIGEGAGEVGRLNAERTVKRLYGALLLVMDTDIGSEHYVRIWADSAPFAVPSADGRDTDYQFGLSITRFIGTQTI